MKKKKKNPHKSKTLTNRLSTPHFYPGLVKDQKNPPDVRSAKDVISDSKYAQK